MTRFASMLCFAFAAAAMLSGRAQAQIENAPPLPFDQPQTMRNFEAVCTGIGADARADPRWMEYPLRVEVVGTTGQYLGQAQVTLTRNGDALVSVGCGGPWVLFKVPSGSYDISAAVEGTTKTAKVNVGGKGQARVLTRFPEIGGATSPGFVPK